MRRGWYDSIVRAWADSPADAVAEMVYLVGLALFGLFLASLALRGFIAGLPYTLLAIPLAWVAAVFFRSVARDARERSRT